MAASEHDTFVSAERLWTDGEQHQAIQMLLDLCRHGRIAEIRLEAALFLLEHLKASSDIDLFLESSAIGIEAAQEARDSRTLAYIMALRAKSLAFLNGIFVMERKNLRLAPEWFGFSLESDERQCTQLTSRIDSNDHEADRLIKEALRMAEEGQDNALRGHVLLSAGNIPFQRYMSLKMDRKPTAITVPWRLRKILGSYGLDDRLLYKKIDRTALLLELEQCERSYCDAAEAFRLAGDDLNAGYAFFNLANDLRSAFRFRKARRYLKKARSIAEEHHDHGLLHSIGLVEKSINLRNRDVPNYAAGETRSQT